jgi:hypothetical protein
VGEYIVLTKWDYFNAFLSILFSLFFISRSFNAAKILSCLLLSSILLLEIRDSIFAVEINFSVLVQAILMILSKFIMGLLIYYFLLAPTYNFYKKEQVQID